MLPYRSNVSLQPKGNPTQRIEEALGYVFRDPSLLHLARIHRSYWNEHREQESGHNERLELLGDSVLSFYVTHCLYRTFPQSSEGDLTQRRARLVEGTACAGYMETLGITDCVLVGKGELTQGRGHQTILADFFEALLGALFLDGGWSPVEMFLSRMIPHQETIREDTNWKSLFQDYAQKEWHLTPTYVTLEEKGPPHARDFLIAVLVGEESWGEGRGRSKKEAEMAAAHQALLRQKKEET